MSEGLNNLPPESASYIPSQWAWDKAHPYKAGDIVSMNGEKRVTL